MMMTVSLPLAAPGSSVQDAVEKAIKLAKLCSCKQEEPTAAPQSASLLSFEEARELLESPYLLNCWGCSG